MRSKVRIMRCRHRCVDVAFANATGPWGRKAPEWVTFPKTVLDTKTAPELGDGNRRRGRYRTAMVTPGCEGSPPTEMDSGTATPGVTSGGTNAFTCRAPEIRPGAAP